MRLLAFGTAVLFRTVSKTSAGDEIKENHLDQIAISCILSAPCWCTDSCCKMSV